MSSIKEKVSKVRKRLKHWRFKTGVYMKPYKPVIGVFLFILIFPLIVGFFYHLPLPQIIAVEAGDLLSFYGAGFGIFGSFLIYQLNKEKEANERRRELRPKLYIDLERDNENGCFCLTILNCSEREITCVHLFDVYVASVLGEQKQVRFCFDGEEDVCKESDVIDIWPGQNLLDDNGVPKYIEIICNDAEENMWDCIFTKFTNGKDFYYPTDISMV